LVFDVDDAAVDEDFVVVAVAAELIVYSMTELTAILSAMNAYYLKKI
jgi:hypothetical protein